MNRMLPSPMKVGCERKDPQNATQDMIGPSGFEERAMAAIVEDDEQTHGEARRQDNQWYHEPH